MAGKAEFDTTADKATETFKTAAAAPETKTPAADAAPVETKN